MKRSVDQKLVRITNQNLIIDTIRQNESATRRSLSKHLQLSVPSVCTNVDQLLELGIVRETEQETPQVGRKAGLLKMNYEFGYVISIDLSNPCITIAISNLKPEIVHEIKFDLEQYQINSLTEQLLKHTDELLNKSGLHRGNLLAISISVPGIVDSNTGIVECGSYLKSLGTVDFREVFHAKYPIPILVQKDIDAAVIGELHYGAVRDFQNIAFVSADVGVGLGIVLGGNLLKGSTNAAGELCKFIIDLNNENARPSLKRLVDYVSIPVLIENVKSELTGGKESGLLAAVGGNINDVTFNAIIQSTLAGDPLCVKQVAESARLMGIAVSNMLLLLDLEAVVLGGGFVTLGSAYTETLEEVVHQLIPSKPRIVNTSLKNKAVLMGGIAIGLDSIFREMLQERSVSS